MGVSMPIPIFRALSLPKLGLTKDPSLKERAELQIWGCYSVSLM